MIQYNTIQDAMVALKQRFGIEMFYDTSRFIAILSDYAPNLLEAQKPIRAFARAGGINSLLKAIETHRQYLSIMETICVSVVSATDIFDDQVEMMSIIRTLPKVFDQSIDEKVDSFSVYNKGLEVYRRFPKEKNIPVSLLLFEEAWEKGCIEALLYISSSFLKGKGVNQDINKGIHYLELAADKNNTKAIIEFAGYLSKGVFVEKDLPRAISLLKRTDDSNALYLLSGIYRENYEHSNAFKYALAAAEKNHVYAQYDTALAYAIGQGTRRDIAEAKKWLRAAALLGHEGARKKLEELGETWT